MLAKQTKTWIVVADGAHARFIPLVKPHNEAIIAPVRVFDRHAAASRDIVSDKPGRSFDRKGHNRHAIEPRTDAHEEAERHFLRDVVEQLAEDFDNQSFDKCVMVSPPRALGYLRQHMPHQLKGCVSLELDKDMVKHTDKEINDAVIEALS